MQGRGAGSSIVPSLDCAEVLRMQDLPRELIGSRMGSIGGFNLWTLEGRQNAGEAIAQWDRLAWELAMATVDTLLQMGGWNGHD